MSIEIPVQFTHSLKIEETAKGIRISVHVYTNDSQTAIDEAMKLYLDTKLRAEKEKIQLAPVDNGVK
jgi:ribosome-associated translation inhibitor RaiA